MLFLPLRQIEDNHVAVDDHEDVFSRFDVEHVTRDVVYENCVDRVAPVVEKLPERGRILGTPSLFPIDCVQSLVDEKRNGA